jgi:hypothetical protein
VAEGLSKKRAPLPSRGQSSVYLFKECGPSAANTKHFLLCHRFAIKIVGERTASKIRVEIFLNCKKKNGSSANGLYMNRLINLNQFIDSNPFEPNNGLLNETSFPNHFPDSACHLMSDFQNQHYFVTLSSLQQISKV